MFKLEAGYVLIKAGFEIVICDSNIILFPCVTSPDSCLEAFALDLA